MLEVPSEGSQVAACVLAEDKVLVRAVDRRLQVGQHRVDPLESRQLTRLAPFHHDVGVRAARVDDPGEASLPVAEHVGMRQQRLPRPVCKSFRGETGYRRDLGVLSWPDQADKSQGTTRAAAAWCCPESCPPSARFDADSRGTAAPCADRE